MKKTCHTLLLLCLLLTAGGAFAGPEEAVFRKLEKTYTLHADGSQEMRCRKEILLNTQRAFNDLYGETFIVYDPDYQSVEIHSAYTRRADGSRLDIPENALNEVLPRQAADAPAFNRLKELVVTHTGLETGATIFLDYSLLTRPGYYPELDIDERLEETSPIRDYTLTIVVPEGKKLAYTLSGSKARAVIDRTDGNIRYRWMLKNIPAYLSQPFLPLDLKDRPRLSASTYPSVEDALEQFVSRFDDRLPDHRKGLIGQLLRDCASADDSISAIRQYVIGRVATIPVSPAETGYRIRPADDVLQSACGTPEEKTNLLGAMLRTAGFSPCVWVAFPADGELADIPQYRGAHRNGLRTARSWGIECNARYWSATQKNDPPVIDRNKQYCFYRIEGGKAVPVTVGQQGSIRSTTTQELTDRDKAAADTDGYVVKRIDLPAGGAASWYGLDRLPGRRDVLLELPRLTKEDYTVSIPVPEDMEVETLPWRIDLQTPFGTLNMSVEVGEKEVTATYRLELIRQQIRPEEYARFCEFIRPWTDRAKKEVVFRKL